MMGLAGVAGDFVEAGIFYVGDTVLPVRSWWTRRGVRGVQQRAYANGEIEAIVHFHRGPLGWWARRWLRHHPLQLTVDVYRPEWGEWRTQIGKVTTR